MAHLALINSLGTVSRKSSCSLFKVIWTKAKRTAIFFRETVPYRHWQNLEQCQIAEFWEESFLYSFASLLLLECNARAASYVYSSLILRTREV